jgi:hypothetical protein
VRPQQSTATKVRDIQFSEPFTQVETMKESGTMVEQEDVLHGPNDNVVATVIPSEFLLSKAAAHER